MFGTPQRHIAGMVAQFVLLLERAIVLFIHHNQAQMGHGREHAQTRADDEFGLAFHRAHKIMAARAHRRLAVQHRRLIAKKAAVDAGKQLRREVDFRQQHQDLLPTRQHLGHGSKIHLGFATAGDAMQKKGLEFTQFRYDGRLSVLLLGIQNKITVKANMAGLGTDVQPLLRLILLQQFARLRVNLLELGQTQLFGLQGLPQGLFFEMAAGRLGCAVFAQIIESIPTLGLGQAQGLAVAQALRQSSKHRRPNWIQIIAAAKRHHRSPLFAQRRRVLQHFQNRQHLIGIEIQFIGVRPHHRYMAFVAKRHHHARAQRQDFGMGIGEQAF